MTRLVLPFFRLLSGAERKLLPKVTMLEVGAKDVE